MRQVDLFALFTIPLERVGIAYMVSGSVASMAYGEPRLTNDIDMILDLDMNRACMMPQLFPEKDFYCPPVEVIKVEIKRPHRGHFNIIHHETGHKADIYMRGSDKLQCWGLEHRRRISIASEKALWLAPPEYVIVRKLEYYREGGSKKHIHDIQGMFDASKDMIDEQTLRHWINRLELNKVWDTVFSELENNA